MLARLAIALDCSTDFILGLKTSSQFSELQQLRFTCRIKELEQLPDIKQKAILKTIDDLIKANS